MTQLTIPWMVPKITMSQIGCNPARAKIERRCVSVAQIIGIATGTKQVPHTTTSKIFTAITGEFLATNLETNVQYTSSVLYLPTGYHNTVLTLLKHRSTLEFAYLFEAVPATNPAGYTYKATSLL